MASSLQNKCKKKPEVLIAHPKCYCLNKEQTMCRCPVVTKGKGDQGKCHNVDCFLPPVEARPFTPSAPPSIPDCPSACREVAPPWEMRRLTALCGTPPNKHRVTSAAVCDPAPSSIPATCKTVCGATPGEPPETPTCGRRKVCPVTRIPRPLRVTQITTESPCLELVAAALMQPPCTPPPPCASPPGTPPCTPPLPCSPPPPPCTVQPPCSPPPPPCTGPQPCPTRPATCPSNRTPSVRKPPTTARKPTSSPQKCDRRWGYDLGPFPPVTKMRAPSPDFGTCGGSKNTMSSLTKKTCVSKPSVKPSVECQKTPWKSPKTPDRKIVKPKVGDTASEARKKSTVGIKPDIGDGLEKRTRASPCGSRRSSRRSSMMSVEVRGLKKSPGASKVSLSPKKRSSSIKVTPKHSDVKTLKVKVSSTSKVKVSKLPLKSPKGKSSVALRISGSEIVSKSVVQKAKTKVPTPKTPVRSCKKIAPSPVSKREVKKPLKDKRLIDVKLGKTQSQKTEILEEFVKEVPINEDIPLEEVGQPLYTIEVDKSGKGVEVLWRAESKENAVSASASVSDDGRLVASEEYQANDILTCEMRTVSVEAKEDISCQGNILESDIPEDTKSDSVDLRLTEESIRRILGTPTSILSVVKEIDAGDAKDPSPIRGKLTSPTDPKMVPSSETKYDSFFSTKMESIKETKENDATPAMIGGECCVENEPDKLDIPVIAIIDASRVTSEHTVKVTSEQKLQYNQIEEKIGKKTEFVAEIDKAMSITMKQVVTSEKSSERRGMDVGEFSGKESLTTKKISERVSESKIRPEEDNEEIDRLEEIFQIISKDKFIEEFTRDLQIAEKRIRDLEISEEYSIDVQSVEEHSRDLQTEECSKDLRTKEERLETHSVTKDIKSHVRIEIISRDAGQDEPTESAQVVSPPPAVERKEKKIKKRKKKSCICPEEEVKEISFPSPISDDGEQLLVPITLDQRTLSQPSLYMEGVVTPDVAFSVKEKVSTASQVSLVERIKITPSMYSVNKETLKIEKIPITPHFKDETSPHGDPCECPSLTHPERPYDVGYDDQLSEDDRYSESTSGSDLRVDLSPSSYYQQIRIKGVSTMQEDARNLRKMVPSGSASKDRQDEAHIEELRKAGLIDSIGVPLSLLGPTSDLTSRSSEKEIETKSKPWAPRDIMAEEKQEAPPCSSGATSDQSVGQITVVSLKMEEGQSLISVSRDDQPIEAEEDYPQDIVSSFVRKETLSPSISSQIVAKDVVFLEEESINASENIVIEVEDNMKSNEPSPTLTDPGRKKLRDKSPATKKEPEKERGGKRIRPCLCLKSQRKDSPGASQDVKVKQDNKIIDSTVERSIDYVVKDVEESLTIVKSMEFDKSSTVDKVENKKDMKISKVKRKFVSRKFEKISKEDDKSLETNYRIGCGCPRDYIKKGIGKTAVRSCLCPRGQGRKDIVEGNKQYLFSRPGQKGDLPREKSRHKREVSKTLQKVPRIEVDGEEIKESDGRGLSAMISKIHEKLGEIQTLDINNDSSKRNISEKASHRYKQKHVTDKTEKKTKRIMLDKGVLCRPDDIEMMICEELRTFNVLEQEKAKHIDTGLDRIRDEFVVKSQIEPQCEHERSLSGFSDDLPWEDAVDSLSLVVESVLKDATLSDHFRRDNQPIEEELQFGVDSLCQGHGLFEDLSPETGVEYDSCVLSQILEEDHEGDTDSSVHPDGNANEIKKQVPVITVSKKKVPDVRLSRRRGPETIGDTDKPKRQDVKIKVLETRDNRESIKKEDIKSHSSEITKKLASTDETSKKPTEKVMVKLSSRQEKSESPDKSPKTPYESMRVKCDNSMDNRGRSESLEKSPKASDEKIRITFGRRQESRGRSVSLEKSSKRTGEKGRIKSARRQETREKSESRDKSPKTTGERRRVKSVSRKDIWERSESRGKSPKPSIEKNRIKSASLRVTRDKSGSLKPSPKTSGEKVKDKYESRRETRERAKSLEKSPKASGERMKDKFVSRRETRERSESSENRGRVVEVKARVPTKEYREDRSYRSPERRTKDQVTSRGSDKRNSEECERKSPTRISGIKKKGDYSVTNVSSSSNVHNVKEKASSDIIKTKERRSQSTVGEEKWEDALDSLPGVSEPYESDVSMLDQVAETDQKEKEEISTLINQLQLAQNKNEIDILISKAFPFLGKRLQERIYPYFIFGHIPKCDKEVQTDSELFHVKTITTSRKPLQLYNKHEIYDENTLDRRMNNMRQLSPDSVHKKDIKRLSYASAHDGAVENIPTNVVRDAVVSQLPTSRKPDTTEILMCMCPGPVKNTENLNAGDARDRVAIEVNVSELSVDHKHLIVESCQYTKSQEREQFQPCALDRSSIQGQSITIQQQKIQIKTSSITRQNHGTLSTHNVDTVDLKINKVPLRNEEVTINIPREICLRQPRCGGQQDDLPIVILHDKSENIRKQYVCNVPSEVVLADDTLKAVRATTELNMPSRPRREVGVAVKSDKRKRRFDSWDAMLAQAEARLTDTEAKRRTGELSHEEAAKEFSNVARALRRAARKGLRKRFGDDRWQTRDKEAEMHDGDDRAEAADVSTAVADFTDRTTEGVSEITTSQPEAGDKDEVCVACGCNKTMHGIVRLRLTLAPDESLKKS